MILRDRIQVIEGKVREDNFGNETVDWTNAKIVATVPAQMDYVTTAIVQNNLSQMRIEETLTAITMPFDFKESTQRIRWRAKSYMPAGSERLVMIGGRVHHMELPLKRITG